MTRSHQLVYLMDYYCKLGNSLKMKKILSFFSLYGLYVTIAGLFDFIWMPWLAYKFRYLTFFPLFLSLFLISLFGLVVYEFFQEDMFFKEKIIDWLAKEGKYPFTKWLKRKINDSPKRIFAVISIWSGPLISYIYFRNENKVKSGEVLKMFSLGTLYCAFFWSVAIDIIVALWDFGAFLARNINL